MPIAESKYYSFEHSSKIKIDDIMKVSCSILFITCIIGYVCYKVLHLDSQ